MDGKMEKEEILARSRRENGNRDFVEEAVLTKANSLALGVGLILCGLVSLTRAILTDSGGEWSVWVVQWGIMATVMLVKYARLRRRHELLLGLFYGGLSLFFAAVYVRGLLGAG